MAKQRRPSTSSTHRYPRTARLNESLREVLAEELVKIDDERLELVTITAIDVDSEMNRATVFFDSLDGESGDVAIVEALGVHRKRLQGAIGRQVRAKKTPILTFRPDEVIRTAAHIEQILHAQETLPVRPADPVASGSHGDTATPAESDIEVNPELEGRTHADDGTA
jgi:ribosome-binding factor A